MLIAIRHRQIGELRPGPQHRPRLCQVVRAHRIGQPLDSHAVEIRLEFAPAPKAVASGNHKLRVVQGESQRVNRVVVRLNLCDSRRLAGGKRPQQLLRLSLELFEIRTLSHLAGG